MRVKGVRIIDFPTVTDSRGSLSFCEAENHIPFKIKRTFWVFDAPATIVRGKHAHRESWQVHVCLSGKAKITVDDGTNRETLVLNNPRQGLMLAPMVWHSFCLEAESLLFVFTSNFYGEEDYIRSFDEFLTLVREGPRE